MADALSDFGTKTKTIVEFESGTFLFEKEGETGMANTVRDEFHSTYWVAIIPTNNMWDLYHAQKICLRELHLSPGVKRYFFNTQSDWLGKTNSFRLHRKEAPFSEDELPAPGLYHCPIEDFTTERSPPQVN